MGVALFHTDLGDPVKAEAAYRMAFQVEPEHVPSRVNLAELLYQQRRVVEAEALFREAVTASENTQAHGIAHDSLARFLIRQKRYDEGIEELKLAVEAMPSHAQTQFFLGVALNSTGKFSRSPAPSSEGPSVSTRPTPNTSAAWRPYAATPASSAWPFPTPKNWSDSTRPPSSTRACSASCARCSNNSNNYSKQ